MTEPQQLCTSWIERSGFGDGKGNLSFNKMVTFTALWIFGISVLRIIGIKQMPPWYVWSFGFGVVGAGFGLKGYALAAARRTEQYNQNDSTAITGDAAAIIKAASDAARIAKLPNLWQDDESAEAKP